MSHEQEQEQVRRLLASARPDDALPPAVAARLDDVLAGLVAERDRATDTGTAGTPDAPGAPVTPLAGRRHRRVVSWAVAAAAAVVVGGVAVGQLVGTGQDASLDAGGSAASEVPSVATEDDGGDEGPSTRDQPEAGGGATAPGPHALADGDDRGSAEDGGEGRAARFADAPRLSSTALEAGLQQLARTAPDPGAMGWLAAESCLPATATPRDALHAVLLDGVPAAVALRPATSEGQEAVVQRCGATRPDHSLRLPAAP